MSSTDNHKKAIAITAACRGNKGALTAIYYKILEDHPAAIINAARELRTEDSIRKSPGGYLCGDCHEMVDAVGIANVCIKCDPSGFDVPY